jgi:hypothetical protein
VIGAAIAANLLLNKQRLGSRILGLIIVGLLSMAAARSARAAMLGMMGQVSEQSASCISGTTILDELKRIPVTQNGSRVLTNIQGLAWYAMRIPTITLTWRALADAPKGTNIIFVRSENTCPEVVESNVSEVALTHAPDFSIVSDNGVFLIGRKH